MDPSRRFIIGIDLGTTNCAVSYFDTETKGAAHIFRIPQLNGQKMWEELPLLPSFYYFLEEDELKGASQNADSLNDFAVGSYAEKQGSKIPTRLVSSAKSWLSNKTCDRKEKILPFDAFDSRKKISPVDASAAFLNHIREAWNKHFAKSNAAFELENQEVILTVPASFDEIARTLTVEAAKKAGIHNFTLLEEPQAAFYSWLMDHGSDAKKYFQPDDTILVCDVGGGTCDFSLIQVSSNQNGLEFQRVQVGPHLLLGGDNMDLAICHYVESLKKEELDSTQWLSLRYAAKAAKEFLLNSNEKATYSLWLSGKGSKVVAGGFGVQLQSDEVQSLLTDGFFAVEDFDKAHVLRKGSTIRSMGLNFEAEPSITKHLAHFLYTCGIKKKPKFLLFNGGALKPAIFQQRIRESIDHWFKDSPPIQLLNSQSLDLAVAKGAAYFAKARRGDGIQIVSGLPRAFYLKIDTDDKSAPTAMTLCERGTKEGTEFELSSLFTLSTNRAVSFEILHSHIRLNDKKEDLVKIDEEEMSLLPPLTTVLRFGKEKEAQIPVKLQVKISELGILELTLHSTKTEHVWKLEFQLRNMSQDTFEEKLEEIVDQSCLEAAKKELREAFAIGSHEKLKNVLSLIEMSLQKNKNEWSTRVLRALYEPLKEVCDKRHLSTAYEARFWNLVGFFLRPGVGHPLDDYRIKELWKWILNDLKKAVPEEIEIQKSIVYRRVSAGLKKGQQVQLFNELLPAVFNQKRKIFILNDKKSKYAFEEKIRTLASLELVDPTLKEKLGQGLLDRILSGKGGNAEYWALGRIGARVLLYGGAQHVISKEIIENWITALLKTPEAQSEYLPFLLFLLSRKTDFREINVSKSLQDLVETFLMEKGFNVSEITGLPSKLEERIFGDSLPPGLRLG